MLERPAVTDHIAKRQAEFHSDIVNEVSNAVSTHDVVVVGMSVNPHVKRARKALDDAGIEHHYLGYGGYTSMWKQRLALKMWAGWPTFPMVFVSGRLIGGADSVAHLLESGELPALIERDRP